MGNISVSADIKCINYLQYHGVQVKVDSSVRGLEWMGPTLFCFIPVLDRAPEIGFGIYLCPEGSLHVKV